MSEDEGEEGAKGGREQTCSQQGTWAEHREHVSGAVDAGSMEEGKKEFF